MKIYEDLRIFMILGGACVCVSAVVVTWGQGGWGGRVEGFGWVESHGLVC